MDLASYIRTVPDFPKPGIQFKDITTLLQNPQAFKYIIDQWKERYTPHDPHSIVGADARGFIFGSALAYAMEKPFVLVRKKGKLPHDTIAEEYELEYGTDVLEIHIDSIQKDDRIIMVDDLLATGGTMEAAGKMVETLGGNIVEMAFVVELPLLKGRERLEKYDIHSLVEFMVD
ncbi:MAG: adenine phosphoribosyltransferase [Candidatus Hydrogenedentota bacterium]|nr:MAG: adenine phosphoribosyltransferase [Candidatus Hydrogenedentota bacterium]